MLMIIDEYKQIPFLSFLVVTLMFLQLIQASAMYAHRDRGSGFLSKKFEKYLNRRSIATSHTIPCHPTGNSQGESYSKTVWNTILLMRNSRNLGLHLRDDFLPEALQAVRYSAQPRVKHLTSGSPLFLESRCWELLFLLGCSLRAGFSKTLCAANTNLCTRKWRYFDTNPRSSLLRFPDARETTVLTSDLAPDGDATPE